MDKPAFKETNRPRGSRLTYAEIGRRFGISGAAVKRMLEENTRKRVANKTMIEAKEMITSSEVGKLLGLHVNTIRRWSDMGLLRAYRMGSRGDRRYLKEDINAILTERTGQLSTRTGRSRPSHHNKVSRNGKTITKS